MNRKPLFIGAAILLLLALLALLFRTNRRAIDWRETYDENSKGPYGAYVIHEMLKTYHAGFQFKTLADSLKGQLPLNSEQPANYVFIGEALYLDSADVQNLLDFVSAGHTAFVSSRTIPYDLMFHLYYDECNDFYWDDYSDLVDTSVRLNFNHSEIKVDTGFVYRYIKRHKERPYRWQFIESYFFCEDEFSLVELGRMDAEHINFARVKYGNGFFYLHTVPLAFSNISMLEKQSLEYANRVFSHLKAGDIYWDRYSRISEMVGRRRNQSRNGGDERRLSAQSPLQYILSQPPLAWAWYLLLIGALLYLVFRAKRRQRIVPVVERNANTSLEFLSTIGRLYFLQNNHRRLCLQKTRLFQAYVRERYHLHFREMDERFISELCAVSETPEAVVRKIIVMCQNIKSSNFVSENTLIDFHLAMDQFYQNCK